MSNKHFFMVFLEFGGAPTFKHTDLKTAEAEAQRLSEAHGRKAYVLCTIKSFEKVKFVIEDCRPDTELPF